MREFLLVLGLCCLVVCFNEASSSVEFDETADFRSNDDEEMDSIVGGTAAKPKEFPFLAGLKLDGSLCGGSLIAPSRILTAAHCLRGKTQSSVSKFTAILNSNNLNGETGSVTKNIAKFVIHPQYNPSTFDNDVALLFLTTPATDIKPIFLPCTAFGNDFAERAAVIAGYGTTSSGGSISTTLLKADVKILNNTACNKQYGDINNNKICAAAPGKDTCQGDSGGPLIVDNILVGVTSYGRGCADPKFAGVYARVSTYINWIVTTN